MPVDGRDQNTRQHFDLTIEASSLDTEIWLGKLEIYAAIRREREFYEAFGDHCRYLCLVLQVGAEPA